MTMNIVCATDDNYVQHCGVMLTSLFENNKEEEIHVYLLTEGLSDGNRQSLKNVADVYNKHFHYHPIDSKLIMNFPLHTRPDDYISLATYYRFLIPNILPIEESKAIYLDCDIIVNSSLNELWNTDISNYAIAAVDEMGTNEKDVFSRLLFNEKYGYFNAGVLLINLAYWRANLITKKCFEYISNNRNRIIAHDQDVLNALLFDKYLHLSCKWNVEETFYHYDMVNKQIHNEEFINALQHPHLLHFTWKPKPWDVECHHPLKEKYFKYLAMTKWKDFIPPFSFRKRIKYIIRNFLVFAKIKKPIYFKF